MKANCTLTKISFLDFKKEKKLVNNYQLKAQRTRRDSFSLRTVFDAWESAQNKLETSYNRHVCANLTSAFADEFETRTSRVRCA